MTDTKPMWICHCVAKRFIDYPGVPIFFTNITKIQGPYYDFEKARDALNAGGARFQSTREGTDHTWTEYAIFSDEQIAREMRLLREMLAR